MAINPCQQCQHCSQVMYLSREHQRSMAAEPAGHTWEAKCPTCGLFTELSEEGHTPVQFPEWVAYPPQEWFGSKEQ